MNYYPYNYSKIWQKLHDDLLSLGAGLDEAPALLTPCRLQIIFPAAVARGNSGPLARRKTRSPEARSADER
ncbi:MAG: hypothetical protein QOJ42_6842 [Acidobacteriaceae bacterium]|jgi:hypothetical protein|nr:hypothetical protein [Acidobacteriaceae bacterium]